MTENEVGKQIVDSAVQIHLGENNNSPGIPTSSADEA